MLLSDHIRRDSDFWLKWLVELYGKDISRLKRSNINRLASQVERFCQNYSGQSEFQIPVALVRKHLKTLHDQLDKMFKSLIPVPSKVWSNPLGRIGAVLWRLPSAQMSIHLHRIHRLKATSSEGPKPKIEHLTWAEENVLKSEARWQEEAMSFTDGAISRVYTARWPHIFWLAIAELLVEGGHRLWRCIKCEKLFIKKKRQVYCSPQCSQTMRSARWYEGHKIEARKRRREALKPKKREATGFPNLKVGRSDKQD